MTLPERLLFWPTLLFASLVMAYSVQTAVSVSAPNLHPFTRDAITIVIFSAIFAPFPALITNFATNVPQEAVLSFGQHFLVILVVTSAVATIRHVIAYKMRPAKEETDMRPRFLRRLDHEVSSEQVLRLTVDDHYVELYLANGESHRILIRFADAVDEMDGIEGLCVHRSHWVASQAIERVERCGGKDYVILTDQSRVPVSRTFRPDLVEAGWIVDRRLKATG